MTQRSLRNVQNRDRVARERTRTYTNLTQELDNGIIVIREVKTVGYDVDNLIHWQVVVAHRISVLNAEKKSNLIVGL